LPPIIFQFGLTHGRDAASTIQAWTELARFALSVTTANPGILRTFVPTLLEAELLDYDHFDLSRREGVFQHHMNGHRHQEGIGRGNVQKKPKSQQ
jgi:hypothetical protein